MDINTFNRFSKVQQLLLIMESGRLVLEKESDSQLFKLYVYKLFYVEIIYDIGSNKVLSINTPDIEYIVDEYLDALSIKDILDL